MPDHDDIATDQISHEPIEGKPRDFEPYETSGAGHPMNPGHELDSEDEFNRGEN